MSSRSIGFIGGGRVTRILLGGLERAGKSPDNCVVSDTDTNVLDALKSRFPGIRTTGDDMAEPAGQDVVFGALHPPVMKEALPRIGDQLRPETFDLFSKRIDTAARGQRDNLETIFKSGDQVQGGRSDRPTRTEDRNAFAGIATYHSR